MDIGKASFCYYLVGRSGAMSRLLVLLLTAVALIVATGAGSSARTERRIDLEVPHATVQFAASSLSNAKRLAVPCLGCTKKACGACAITCSAYCAAGAALLSHPGVLAPVIFSG